MPSEDTFEVDADGVLDLSGRALRHIPSLGDKNVRVLDVSRNSIGVFDPSRLPAALEELHAGDNFVADASALGEARCSRSLRVLSAPGNALRDPSPVLTATSLPSLEVADLSGNRLESLPCPGAFPKGLKELYAGRNRVASVLEGPGTSRSLTRLVLDNCRVADLSFLAALPSLEELNVDGNRIADLSGLAACPSLRKITARDNRASVSSALRLPRVEEVDVSGNAVASLACLDGCGSLRVLCCARNDLAGPLALPASLASLEHLDVSGNALTGLQGLAHAPRCAVVLASSNRIASVDGALAEVRALAQVLRELDLRGNPDTVGFYPDITVSPDMPPGGDPYPGIEQYDALFPPPVSADAVLTRLHYRLGAIDAFPRLAVLDRVTVSETERTMAAEYADARGVGAPGDVFGPLLAGARQRVRILTSAGGAAGAPGGATNLSVGSLTRSVHVEQSRMDATGFTNRTSVMGADSSFLNSFALSSAVFEEKAVASTVERVQGRGEESKDGVVARDSEASVSDARDGYSFVESHGEAGRAEATSSSSSSSSLSSAVDARRGGAARERDAHTALSSSTTLTGTSIASSDVSGILEAKVKGVRGNVDVNDLSRGADRHLAPSVRFEGINSSSTVSFSSTSKSATASSSSSSSSSMSRVGAKNGDSRASDAEKRPAASSSPPRPTASIPTPERKRARFGMTSPSTPPLAPSPTASPSRSSSKKKNRKDRPAASVLGPMPVDATRFLSEYAERLQRVAANGKDPREPSAPTSVGPSAVALDASEDRSHAQQRMSPPMSPTSSAFDSGPAPVAEASTSEEYWSRAAATLEAVSERRARGLIATEEIVRAGEEEIRARTAPVPDLSARETENDRPEPAETPQPKTARHAAPRTPKTFWVDVNATSGYTPHPERHDDRRNPDGGLFWVPVESESSSSRRPDGGFGGVQDDPIVGGGFSIVDDDDLRRGGTVRFQGSSASSSSSSFAASDSRERAAAASKNPRAEYLRRRCVQRQERMRAVAEERRRRQDMREDGRQPPREAWRPRDEAWGGSEDFEERGRDGGGHAGREPAGTATTTIRRGDDEEFGASAGGGGLFTFIPAASEKKRSSAATAGRGGESNADRAARRRQEIMERQEARREELRRRHERREPRDRARHGPSLAAKRAEHHRRQQERHSDRAFVTTGERGDWAKSLRREVIVRRDEDEGGRWGHDDGPRGQGGTGRQRPRQRQRQRPRQRQRQRPSSAAPARGRSRVQAEVTHDVVPGAHSRSRSASRGQRRGPGATASSTGRRQRATSAHARTSRATDVRGRDDATASWRASLRRHDGSAPESSRRPRAGVSSPSSSSPHRSGDERERRRAYGSAAELEERDKLREELRDVRRRLRETELLVRARNSSRRGERGTSRIRFAGEYTSDDDEDHGNGGYPSGRDTSPARRVKAAAERLQRSRVEHAVTSSSSSSSSSSFEVSRNAGAMTSQDASQILGNPFGGAAASTVLGAPGVSGAVDASARLLRLATTAPNPRDAPAPAGSGNFILQDLPALHPDFVAVAAHLAQAPKYPGHGAYRITRVLKVFPHGSSARLGSSARMLFHAAGVRELSQLLQVGFPLYGSDPERLVFSSGIAIADELFLLTRDRGNLPRGTTVTWRAMVSVVDLGMSHETRYAVGETTVDAGFRKRLHGEGYSSISFAKGIMSTPGRDDYMLLDAGRALPAYLIEYEFQK